MAIKDTLEDREKTHGRFTHHACISQALKGILAAESKYCNLMPIQREALEMICHKMARIMSGNAGLIDHWHDIAGYATLVEEELREHTKSVVIK